MASPPDGQHSGMVVPLHEHIDLELSKLDLRIEYVEKGIETAYTAMNSRLAGMNELREDLRTQAGMFVTRAEHDALAVLLSTQADSLKSQAAGFIGRAEHTVVVDKLNEEITKLRTTADRQQGMATQQQVLFTQAMTLAVLAVTIILHFVK